MSATRRSCSDRRRVGKAKRAHRPADRWWARRVRAFAHPTKRSREQQPRLIPFLLQPANVLLGVKLEPDALDQVELRLEEVDVLLLGLHQFLEQVARDVILYAVAIGRRLLIEVACAVLGGEITVDDLRDG